MHRDRLNSKLVKIYQPEETDQRCKQALETNLLSRYRTLYPKNRRWLMLLNPWNRIASDLLIAQPGVEDASVSISQQSSGEISLYILAWGTGFNENDLVTTLTSEYPNLAGASVSVNDLNTTIKESLVSKLGRKLFSVEISGSDPEELRQQVLQQMAAEGITGDAKVEVQTEGDQQTISIEIEEE